VIQQQTAGSQSVSTFCAERGLTEQSLYSWRNRLSEQAPVSFALATTDRVDRGPGAPLELELSAGRLGSFQRQVSVGGCPRKRPTRFEHKSCLRGRGIDCVCSWSWRDESRAVRAGQPVTQPTPTAETFRMGFNFQADALPSAPPSLAPAPLYAGADAGLSRFVPN
jgi:transposase-like protein